MRRGLSRATRHVNILLHLVGANGRPLFHVLIGDTRQEDIRHLGVLQLKGHNLLQVNGAYTAGKGRVQGNAGARHLLRRLLNGLARHRAQDYLAHKEALRRQADVVGAVLARTDRVHVPQAQTERQNVTTLADGLVVGQVHARRLDPLQPLNINSLSNRQEAGHLAGARADRRAGLILLRLRAHTAAVPGAAAHRHTGGVLHNSVGTHKRSLGRNSGHLAVQLTYYLPARRTGSFSRRYG